MQFLSANSAVLILRLSPAEAMSRFVSMGHRHVMPVLMHFLPIWQVSQFNCVYGGPELKYNHFILSQFALYAGMDDFCGDFRFPLIFNLIFISKMQIF